MTTLPVSRVGPSMALLWIAIACAPATTRAEPPAPKPREIRDGRRDFDLRFGDWRVQHRRLKERLANSHEWIEFDGTISMRPLMGGLANVGDNVFNLPDGAYRGVSLRAYDPRTGLWALWWLDGRNPLGELDPPMKGRFEQGAGTFYGDDTFKGKPIRVRIVWSKVTDTSAHWEQASSADGGKTWEVNWISDFRRVAAR
jgi:hypothetical protein